MPRRNRNPGQAQATHRLDRFEKWAEKILAENGKEMSAVVDTPTPIKSPPQRIINNRKKGDESNAKK